MELEEQSIRVSELNTNDAIAPALWSALQACHFGIVISTGFNRNVLLEWGYLLGCGKPVLRLHQGSGDGENDPFNISGTMRFQYAAGGAQLTEEGVRNAVRDGIRAIMAENDDMAELMH